MRVIGEWKEGKRKASELIAAQTPQPGGSHRYTFPAYVFLFAPNWLRGSHQVFASYQSWLSRNSIPSAHFSISLNFSVSSSFIKIAQTLY